MTVYFTSDHHFGHAAARGFYHRPFASAAAMDQTMIACWNAVVGPEDDVWHLGDFAVRQSSERITSLLTLLNGRKYLVTGNNDDEAVTSCPLWLKVLPYAELTIDGRHVVLCHYPFRTWRDMGKGAVNLHGHSHGRLKPLPRQFDVGVDVRDFRPIPLAELLLGSTRRPSPRR